MIARYALCCFNGLWKLWVGKKNISNEKNANECWLKTQPYGGILNVQIWNILCGEQMFWKKVRFKGESQFFHHNVSHWLVPYTFFPFYKHVVLSEIFHCKIPLLHLTWFVTGVIIKVICFELFEERKKMEHLKADFIPKQSPKRH